MRARAVSRRAAAVRHGGPPPRHRPRPVQPRRHARARQDRAPGLRRAVARVPPSPRWSASACCSASLARVAFCRGRRDGRRRASPTRTAVRVARSRARNFYYSFVLLLAPQQRKAMCAIYAFMRYCDDLSDEPGATRAAIERWRADLDAALEGRFSDHPVLARLPRHRAPLRHSARVFPRDDRRRASATWSRAASRPSTSSTATATRWLRWSA